MRILVTNDDGHDAGGIVALAESLRDLGEVTIVAPKENNSGVSAALSLRRKVAVAQNGSGAFVVDGTPADCVHLGFLGGFAPRPDIVVSGINNAPNLGEDTIYSGTVAAAVCAHLYGVPGVALSMATFNPQHYGSACEAARQIIKRGENKLMNGAAAVLNVNVPDLPPQEIAGNTVTRLGRRAESDSPLRNDIDASGEMHFQVGDSGGVVDGGEGTDFHAVAHGYVSITPLIVAGTDARAAQDIGKWLNTNGES